MDVPKNTKILKNTSPKIQNIQKHIIWVGLVFYRTAVTNHKMRLITTIEIGVQNHQPLLNLGVLAQYPGTLRA